MAWPLLPQPRSSWAVGETACLRSSPLAGAASPALLLLSPHQKGVTAACKADIWPHAAVPASLMVADAIGLESADFQQAAIGGPLKAWLGCEKGSVEGCIASSFC